MKLAYWDIRGLASPIRNLLRYAAVDFEDEALAIEGPPYTLENWYNQKFTLELDFPNLPYLIDGDLKLTQSHAILRYLGRKFGLAATSDPQMAIEEMLLFQLHDFQYRLFSTLYFNGSIDSKEFKNEMKALQKDLNDNLDKLESYLKNDWLMGEILSHVDFLAYEVIDRFRELINKDCLEKYPKLSIYMKRFEALEKLKDWLASDEFKKKAISGPFAKFGNTRRN